MAEIIPFRALHYDAGAVGNLGKVVTQPYDKITPDMQARYYQTSSHNLVRIIRRLSEAGETDPYAAAARDFRGWISQGVLVRDTTPALYPYDQEYAVPGTPHVRKRRRGFIALCRLEEYAAHVVHRHEETLSGPKADRLALLQATRAHFGQIFLLYSDPEGALERDIAAWAGQNAPWESVDDEYGTRHTVWRLASGPLLSHIPEALRERKLVIADGHHRYETALAYRRSLPESARTPATDYVMATFVRMESEGLVILPTHRVIHGLLGFDWTIFLSEATRYFDVKELSGEASQDLRAWRDKLSQAGRGAPAFLAYAGHRRAALLETRESTEEMEMAGTPPGLARLDVFILHRLVIEQVLGISRDAVREEKNIHYEREAEAAVSAVDQGRANLCLLVNPTPIEAVRDNAFAGQPMPQKSTDFYPKLLSGLTIYDLEDA
ncbi:MAG TPA: DUF1015 domain-containing protein [Terriglobia bacterium]|nr:DUF1015 domain-containing protein [Terriglobia bacterium]